jgi:hypothetical protein
VKLLNGVSVKFVLPVHAKSRLENLIWFVSIEYIPNFTQRQKREKVKKKGTDMKYTL